MKKTVFFFGAVVFSILTVSCSTDDLEITDNSVNQQVLVDDFDYSSSTFKDGDENNNSSTVNLDNTDPVVSTTKKD